MTVTCEKLFENLPFAHRQHKHDGHCAWIHGHNWSFELTFAADHLDENEFVVDFGKLKFVRKWLEDQFDHTLVLNEDDPHLSYLRTCLVESPQTSFTGAPIFAKIVIVPNCGAEGLGKFILEKVNALFAYSKIGVDRNLRVQRVRVFEDEKNSATVSLN